MGVGKTRWVRGLALLGLACFLLSGAGCVVVNTSDSDGGEVRHSISKIWPRREGDKPPRSEQLSLKGSASEFGRGVTNVAFCWLELPYELEQGIRQADDPGLGGLIKTAWGIVEGTVEGTFGAVGRAVGGVLEVAFCPFPPYDPLMRPARPPYLNFPQRAPKREVKTVPEPEPESSLEPEAGGK